MGRLVIAHHKSYHPYRRDNIEKVRRDEEEAQLKEAKEEGRLMLADSEARIDRLREKVGASSRSRKGKEKAEDLMPPPASLPGSGHINFFEDLEQNAITAAVRASRGKKDEVTEDDKGVRLAPSQKDLNPWYTEKRKEPSEADEMDDKRRRDTARKSAHDPLTSITHQLSSRPSSSSSSSIHIRSQSSRHPSSSNQLTTTTTSDNPQQARLSRESSERERALALIRKKKRELEGSETPSTVCGGDTEGYGDVYNRKEVEEAHRRYGGRGRGDYRYRRWDEDRGSDRRRGSDYGREERGSRRQSWGR